MNAFVAIAVAAALSLAAPGAAPPQGPELAPNDWLTFFYQHQRAELTGEMVARLDRDGVLGRANARPAVVAFFSLILRRDDVRGEELVGSADLSPSTRSALLEALWRAGKGAAATRIATARGLPSERFAGPPPELLRMPLEAPGDLDMMWGAFMASGDVAFPRRLLDVLDVPPRAGGETPQQAILVKVARWSLASNARQHPVVLQLIRDEAGRRTGSSKTFAEEVVAEHAAPPPPDAAPAAPMIRLVTRDVSPDVPRGSFGAKPKTLYRLGEKYGRMEEEPDPAEGIHGLIVVSEPRVWMVNLANMTGQRITDPGPSFVFRAPIIPVTPKGAPPPMFELGLEYDFMKAHGAKPKKVVIGGKRQEALVAQVGGYVITLAGDRAAERPSRVKVEQKGKTLIELDYVEYARDLPPRMELFVPPPGVQFRDAE
jgi:hypothetical protein